MRILGQKQEGNSVLIKEFIEVFSFSVYEKAIIMNNFKIRKGKVKNSSSCFEVMNEHDPHGQDNQTVDVKCLSDFKGSIC